MRIEIPKFWDMNKKEFEDRTKQFGLQVIQFVTGLPRSKVSEVLGRQVLRSATSIGANYREANRGESRDDFIHKIAIVEKEAAETQYWLELLQESGTATPAQLEPLLKECGELLAIFTAVGRTTKARRQ